MAAWKCQKRRDNDAAMALNAFDKPQCKDDGYGKSTNTIILIDYLLTGNSGKIATKIG